MRPEDLIWNRACEGGGPDPRPGDRALAALLRAHGLAMNGGVLHAAEFLNTPALSDATSGYRFFGLNSVADLLVRAQHLFRTGTDLETHEKALNKQYAVLIPDDAFLGSVFERHLKSNPSDFAAP